MSKHQELEDVTSTYSAIDALNSNFDKIETALENTLSLDGSAPNALNADIDLNHNRIRNVGSPQHPTDLVRLADMLAIAAPTGSDLNLLGTEVGAELVGFTNGEGSSVLRTIGDKLRDTLSVKDFGAVGDYNPNTLAGTDDTAAIQAAIDSMAVIGGLDINPSTLIFPKAYYKITAPIQIPYGWIGNEIDFQGSRIYYRGTVDNTAAIFKITKNQFVRNTFRNGSLYCENRAGFGFYVAGEAGSYVASEVSLDTINILQPVVRAIQLGRQSVTGFDQDMANWTFRDVRLRLEDGQEGVEIDADNNFDTCLINCFLGGNGASLPGTYLRLKKGNSLYCFGTFTGNNGVDVPAVEINEGNATFTGWNSEGFYLLKMQGFTGGAGNVLVQNVNVNDSEGDGATVSTAINAVDGELTLRSAKLSNGTGRIQNVIVGDKLIADGVWLGSNSDGSIFGQFLLDNPQRCIIDGKHLTECRSLNPNPNFHLWWGSAADDMPIGYEKSALGTATVTRSTANSLHTAYTARLQIAAGAAVSGQLIDGLISRTAIGMNTMVGARSFVGIVRGKVTAISGTTAVKLRMTFINAFGTPNGSNETTWTPDADGNFTAIVGHQPDVLDPPGEILLNLGLGVNGATADIYIQTCHLIQYDPYLQGSSQSYKGLVDAWTKYPAELDLVEEQAKAGVTARFDSAVSGWVREWFAAAAPTSGTHTRGSRVINSEVAAGGSPGWICTTAGSPGTWKAEGNVAA